MRLLLILVLALCTPFSIELIAQIPQPVLVVDPCAFADWEHPPTADSLVWYELHGAVEREALFAYFAKEITALDRIGRSTFVQRVDDFGRASIEILEQDDRCSNYEYYDTIRSRYGIIRSSADELDRIYAFGIARSIVVGDSRGRERSSWEGSPQEVMYFAFIDSALSRFSSNGRDDYERKMRAIHSEAKAVTRTWESRPIQDRYQTFLVIDRVRKGNAVGIATRRALKLSIRDTITRIEWLEKERWDSIRNLNDPEITFHTPVSFTILPKIRSWKIAEDSIVLLQAISDSRMPAEVPSLRIYTGIEVPSLNKLDERVASSLFRLQEFLEDYSDTTWPLPYGKPYGEVFRLMVASNLTADSATFHAAMTGRYAFNSYESDFGDSSFENTLETELEMLRIGINALTIDPPLEQWRSYAIFSEGDTSRLLAAFFVPPGDRENVRPVLLNREQLVGDDRGLSFPTGWWDKETLAEFEHDVHTGACGTYRLRW